MPSLTESVAERKPENAVINPSLSDSNRMKSRVPLAMTFDELLGDDTAPDETADELIQAVRQGRDMPSGGGLD